MTAGFIDRGAVRLRRFERPRADIIAAASKTRFVKASRDMLLLQIEPLPFPALNSVIWFNSVIPSKNQERNYGILPNYGKDFGQLL